MDTWLPNLFGRCPDCTELFGADEVHFWLWHFVTLDGTLVCEKASHSVPSK